MRFHFGSPNTSPNFEFSNEEKADRAQAIEQVKSLIE
jgi:hypothetical protein